MALKDQRSSSFVGVCLAPALPGQPLGCNGLYCLTEGGVLLLMRSTGRMIDRQVSLQVQQAFGLAATSKQVACACAGSVVRLFSAKALAHRANLPHCYTRTQAAGVWLLHVVDCARASEQRRPPGARPTPSAGS